MIEQLRIYTGQIILFALSLAAAFIGVNWSYHSVLPGDDRFQGLGKHGWLLDGATLNLPKLATMEHQIEFNLAPGRPEELGPALIKPTICEVAASPLVIPQDQISFRLTLPPGCHNLTLHVENPFIPGHGDERPLIVQAANIRITSALGFPLLQLQYVFHWTVLIFILSILSNILLRPSGPFLFLSYLVPLFCCALLASAGDYRWSLVEQLFLVTIAVLLGVFLGVRTGSLNDPLRWTGINSVTQRDYLYWLLLGAIIVGGALRFCFIDWGFPMVLHPDEARKVGNIGRMVARHSLEPQNFLHPTLLLYLTLFVTKIFDLLEIQLGSLRVLLAGRFVSALAGTLSIPLLYLVGQRLVGRKPAVLAAVVLAFLPLHVTCSRYMKEDALLVCCVLAAVGVMVRAVQSGELSRLYLSGVLTGVACGAKYTGLTLLPVLLTLPFFRSRSLRPDRAFLLHIPSVLLAASLGFVLTTPFSLFSFESFLDGVQTERSHLNSGHDVKIDAWSQFWMFHFIHSLLPGMTVPVVILSLVGVGMLLRRRTAEALFLLLLVAAFYLPAEFAKSKPAPQAERYILGSLPFLCLAAAEFIAVVSNQGRGLLLLLLSGVLIVSPAYRSIALATEIRPDTRWQMAEWIKSELPPESSFLIESRYAPKLKDTNLTRKFLSPGIYHKTLTLEALEASGFDYLLVTSLSYERYFREPSASRLIRNRFNSVFINLPLAKEFRSRQGSYGFHNPTVRLYAISKRAKRRLVSGKAATGESAVE